MKNLMIQAITDNGAVVYASINVSNDYTMNEVNRAVINRGFEYFRIVSTMKRFARVIK